MGSQPKKKNIPKLCIIISTNRPSITGCPNGSLIYRDKPSDTLVSFPRVLFPLWAICWLKTPFLQASNLPPRPLPPANGSSHPNWLKHHQRCVASPQPSEDFVGGEQKSMPKNISNCLNPMYFWVDPLFLGRMVDQDPKTCANHVFHWLRSQPHHLPSPIPWSVLTACIQARKQNSQISESITWAANSLAGLTPSTSDASAWNSGSSFSACFHDILSLWFNFGWKIATPKAPKIPTLWLLF